MLANSLTIGSRAVGGAASPYVIAEAGSNFDQSLDKAKKLIDVAAEAGADAVKFQLFRADALQQPGTELHKVFKSVELNADWVPALAEHSRAAGIHFLASPFDRGSVDVLEAVGVEAYKIASSEAAKPDLVAYMAAKGKPILLATGMCDFIDIEEAVATCLRAGNDKVALLQCGSVYPLPPEQANLRVMDVLAARYGGVVGYSDHTLGLAVPVAAVGRGAAIIEKHFTLDKTSSGPDHFYALEPAELKQMFAMIREAHAALGSPDKDLLPDERKWGRRDGIYLARDVAAGQSLGRDDLEVRSPALGIRARNLGDALKFRARGHLVAGNPLTWEDLEP